MKPIVYKGDKKMNHKITLPDYKVFDDKTHMLNGVFEFKSEIKEPDKAIYGTDFSGNEGWGRYREIKYTCFQV